MGIYLSSPNQEKDTINGASTSGRIRYAASGMQGWRVNMEDAHITKTDISPDVSVFGVFDGHGGREVARFTERHFIEELLKNQNFKLANYDKALEETFLKMDELLLTPEGKRELSQIKNEDEKGDGGMDSYAGCTANVVLIAKNIVYCANAGDSRAVLCSKGQAVELSNDHKPELDKERDRVVKAGGYISDGRINGNLNLSRAIGDLEYKKNSSLKVDQQLIIAFPEIKVRTLTEDDKFIIMGCDGIWETMTNQKIVDFVDERLTQGLPLTRVVEDLLDANLASDTSMGTGCDNMTSILIVFDHSKKQLLGDLAVGLISPIREQANQQQMGEFDCQC
eukprot:TRINITY_DN776_c0_g2_i2.p1 TRINITY_DN776_c0_g2~~TRINITY_DN776_c0_g2_i2.p1  ORF type:complete len:337 (+),score=100.29 TRINITY_DN776_c0_g2_i2:71-1081(+)